MSGKSTGWSSRSSTPISRDDLVTAMLGALATDPDRLQAFLAETGQDPADLRRGLAAGHVQAGLIDFLVNNDDLIVAVGRALQRKPEDVAGAAIGFRAGTTATAAIAGRRERAGP